LLPWQTFVVGSLIAWKKGDVRRFRFGFVEAGKGSGKTPLASALALYGLVADDEPGAQILLGATKYDQARIAFDDCAQMVAASPTLARRITRTVNTLSVTDTNSVLRAVSSDQRTLDGFRPHLIVVDELHEHATNQVLVKLSAGVKARRQPLTIAMTNAGMSRESVCWAQHAYGLQVVEGTIENDEHYVYICTLDPCAACRADGAVAPVDGCARCDAWTNERVWLKTNPSVPTTPTMMYLRDQVRQAQGMPATQTLIRRLVFCEWPTSSATRWLDMQAWQARGAAIEDADLVGQPCWAGLDLGLSEDFSALALVWMLDDGRVVVRCRYWLPEAALEAHPGRPYDAWRRAGHLMVTPGNVTDYEQVQADVLGACRECGVRELAYDKRFAGQMALWLQGQGMTMMDTPQGHALNEPLVRLAELVKARGLVHGGDPILTWMASNSIVHHGMSGVIRLDKEKSGDQKVDGIAAMAMAMSRAITQPSESVYDQRARRGEPVLLVM
jgi:phage terminase large subunit-like protein